VEMDSFSNSRISVVRKAVLSNLLNFVLPVNFSSIEQKEKNSDSLSTLINGDSLKYSFDFVCK